jgi:hypothetical protein
VSIKRLKWQQFYILAFEEGKPFCPKGVQINRTKNLRKGEDTMKSRALKILPMTIGLVLIVVSVSWARDPISHRHMKQSQRITHGIRSGEIKDRGFVSLNREQRRIGKYERRAKHDRASHYAARPIHKNLHFWHRRVYHDYYVSGIFFEPLWSVGWSIGWR